MDKKMKRLKKLNARLRQAHNKLLRANTVTEMINAAIEGSRAAEKLLKFYKK